MHTSDAPGETPTLIRTVCPHDCPDQCSILATVANGQLLRVTGDPDHAFTRGFLCNKVNRYPERIHSPERLLTPLRRTGAKGAAQFEEITWEEALDEVVMRWRSLIETHGPESLLGYAYSGHQGLVNRSIFTPLFHALGASRLITGTVCDSACDTGWEYAIGHTPGTDPESAADSDLIICWGHNAVSTNLHFMPFVNMARSKGAQFIVIDPYRTRTARHADWHLMPKVGTDGALVLGLMHVIVREGLHNPAYIATHTIGFERLRDEVLGHYAPDYVASVTGIEAADIERLAIAYGRARAPFIRVGQGLSRHSGGGMTIRNITSLPALVGAWGKPGGGALLMTGLAWQYGIDAIRRPDLLKHPTRQLNHSTLGRSLLEESPPIMALFVAGNNPAVTCPDSGRMMAGLRREDLFTVVHDMFLTETARYADLVLPACAAMETDDLYRSYGSYYTQYGQKLLEPAGQSRSNVWLVQELARRLGFDDPVFTKSTHEHIQALLEGACGETALIDQERLMKGEPMKLSYPSTGPAVTYFYSEEMAAAGLEPLPSWKPDPVEQAESERWPLRLLTAPGHSQHHTVFAGVASLRQQEGAPRCLLHPADAARRGIESGQLVALFNDLGHVGLRATVTEDTLPGVVVVEGQRNRAAYVSGGPLNVLIADRLTDMGAGATYQSTWLEACLLDHYLQKAREAT